MADRAQLVGLRIGGLVLRPRRWRATTAPAPASSEVSAPQASGERRTAEDDEVRAEPSEEDRAEAAAVDSDDVREQQHATNRR